MKITPQPKILPGDLIGAGSALSTAVPGDRNVTAAELHTVCSPSAGRSSSVGLSSKQKSGEQKTEIGGRRTWLESLLSAVSISALAPEGYEDETGFHFGRPECESFLDNLSPRQQQMAELLMGQPQSLRSMARQMGVTAERARQLKGTVARKLRWSLVRLNPKLLRRMQ